MKRVKVLWFWDQNEADNCDADELSIRQTYLIAKIKPSAGVDKSCLPDMPQQFLYQFPLRFLSMLKIKRIFTDFTYKITTAYKIINWYFNQLIIIKNKEIYMLFCRKKYSCIYSRISDRF